MACRLFYSIGGGGVSMRVGLAKARSIAAKWKISKTQFNAARKMECLNPYVGGMLVWSNIPGKKLQYIRITQKRPE